MCVQVVISVLDRKRGGNLTPEGLAKASGLRAFVRDDGRMQLDLQEGCGCFFVVGDLRSGDWKLAPSFRDALVKAIEFAGSQTKKFRFSVTWLGEPAPRVEDVALEELTAKIQNGVVSGQYLYNVQAA